MRVVLGLMETVKPGIFGRFRLTIELGRLKSVLTVKSLFYYNKCLFGEGEFKYRDYSDGYRETATGKS